MVCRGHRGGSGKEARNCSDCLLQKVKIKTWKMNGLFWFLCRCSRAPGGLNGQNLVRSIITWVCLQPPMLAHLVQVCKVTVSMFFLENVHGLRSQKEYVFSQFLSFMSRNFGFPFANLRVSTVWVSEIFFTPEFLNFLLNCLAFKCFKLFFFTDWSVYSVRISDIFVCVFRNSGFTNFLSNWQIFLANLWFLWI